MDEPLAKAYADLEKQIKEALEEHPGNHSVISTALNTCCSPIRIGLTASVI